MAWFIAKNAPGDFLNFAGAVNKLMESGENIEKNFDTALSFEEKGEFGHEDSFYLRSVNMLQESGKNIEKHFDTALGFEEKRESGNEGNLYLRSENMLQESVKNIEKNFDTALGFEEKGESNNEDSILELEMVKWENEMMEEELLGAARQAQVFHKLYIIFKEIKKAFECTFIFVASVQMGRILF